MSGEINLPALSLVINKAGVTNGPRTISIPSLVRDMAGTNIALCSGETIGSGTVALPMGSVTAPHFGLFINNDAANSITLYNGATSIAMLSPGDPALIPLPPVVNLRATSAPGTTTGLEYLIASL